MICDAENGPEANTSPVDKDNVTRWIVDQHFRKEQERLKIPLGTVSSSLTDVLCEICNWSVTFWMN